MKKFYLLLIASLVVQIVALSQTKALHSYIETQAGATTNGAVPFWMRSNQYGSVPLAGGSISVITGARIDYDTAKKHLVDWGASFEGRTNLGKTSAFTLIEGYGKLRIGFIELKAGRVKEFMGLVDSTLSSGAFSISGNALGIPKVQIGVADYTNIFGGKLFAFKGNFAHGWVGEVPINDSSSKTGGRQSQTYFHQSSLYGRFGKPDWKLKLYGGINHQVYWGEQKTLPEYKLNSALQTFLYVISGKTANRFSKVGNHLGSIDLGLQYEFPTYTLFAYRQNFYDVGALATLANIKDGLNGISIQNKVVSNNKFKWRKLLFEILTTTNQAGYPWSKATASGDEDYYNNYVYKQGWTYNQLNLGSPFLTTRNTAKPGLASDPGDYFINNRVLAFNAGFQGSVQAIQLISKVSYSENYGTFGTSIYGHSLGQERNPGKVLFKKAGQFSAYIEGKHRLRSGINLGIAAAIDKGQLLQNSVGIIGKVSKEF